MPAILVVCTGNICRSPVAEVLLRARLREYGLSAWQVHSAGTWAMPEQNASHYGMELLAEQGLDLSTHRSRRIAEVDMAEADLVLCMAAHHAEALRAEFPQHASKVYLLTEMVEDDYDIGDPYGGPRRAYEVMIRDVSRLLDEGLPRIIALAGNEKRTEDGRHYLD